MWSSATWIFKPHDTERNVHFSTVSSRRRTGRGVCMVWCIPLKFFFSFSTTEFPSYPVQGTSNTCIPSANFGLSTRHSSCIGCSREGTPEDIIQGRPSPRIDARGAACAPSLLENRYHASNLPTRDQCSDSRTLPFLAEVPEQRLRCDAGLLERLASWLAHVDWNDLAHCPQSRQSRQARQASSRGRFNPTLGP